MTSMMLAVLWNILVVRHLDSVISVCYH
jgi:hypothetical protein